MRCLMCICDFFLFVFVFCYVRPEDHGEDQTWDNNVVGTGGAEQLLRHNRTSKCCSVSIHGTDGLYHCITKTGSRPSGDSQDFSLGRLTLCFLRVYE